MKKLKYFLFKRLIYERWLNFEYKKIKRLEAIIKARKELKKYYDIPFSCQKESIAKILYFPDGDYPSDSFMYALAGSFEPGIIWRDEVLARALPLKWFE